MKKNIIGLMVILFVVMVNPLSSAAATKTTASSIVVVKPAETAKVKALLLRLDEIKAMDKSNLQSSDKKKLRIEVRAIRSELRENGGVYLSVGAIIIIALLLIIIL